MVTAVFVTNRKSNPAARAVRASGAGEAENPQKRESRLHLDGAAAVCIRSAKKYLARL
jgi:hypothetical protein